MTKSASSNWQKVGGEPGEDGEGLSDVFKISEFDEVANGGSDFKQNESIYIIVQHDPSILITDVKSSMGVVRPNGSVTYTKSPGVINFNTDNQEYQFPYIPSIDSVTGIWFIGYPSKTFNSPGTPEYTLSESKRKLTVDIENFNNGQPAPFALEYKAKFLQYEFIPVKTDLPPGGEYHVGITFFYKEI